MNTQTSKGYSRLAQCKPPRPLPVALAQLLVNTPMSQQERHALLGKFYLAMRPVDQLRCDAEMHLCRAAKRCELIAAVS